MNNSKTSYIASSRGNTETYAIISTMAYLSGVERRHFENEFEPPKMERFLELELDRSARIIRNLCMIRTAIEQNYSSINNAMRYDMKNLHTLPQYIPQDCISTLVNDGIDLLRANHKLNCYIVDINRLISQHIYNCKSFFPDWLNWDYIRELFVVPMDCTESGVRKQASHYYAHKNSYPYQVYLSWTLPDQGNIFYNDRKFVTLLYAAHGEKFQDFALVSSAGYATNEDVFSFLRSNEPVVIAVDCENADPYKLYGMLISLDQEALLGRIKKLVLYTDANAGTAWDLFEYFVDLTVERHVLARLKEHKSLVDIQMAAGVTREYYQGGTKAFVLVSSDSDYWGLISTLPEANYLVVIEEEKCSSAIKEALNSAAIMYYSMDGFSPSRGPRAIASALLRQIVAALPEEMDNFDLQALLDNIRQSARLIMSESEWQQFYGRFVQPLKIFISGRDQAAPQMC